MKKLNKSLVALTVAAAGVMTAGSVMAADEGFYLVPSVGYHYIDKERVDTTSLGATDYNDDSAFGLAAGYQLDANTAVELGYNRSNPDFRGTTSEDARIDYLHLDALRNVGKFGALEPFVVAGIGHQLVNPQVPGLGSPATDTQDETVANAGFGLNVKVAKNLSVRTDARALYSFDNETTDAIASVGLNWLALPARQAAAPVAVVDGDSDNDGVANSVDKCPNTKAGARVDASGCYLKLASTKSFSMDIKFATDSSNITQASLAEVSELAAFMKQYPEANVVLEGHTDSRGSEAYNKQLSERRAIATGQALVSSFGINASRISTVGYGESRPVASNATAAGRAQNRRTVGNVQATITK